MIRKEGTEMTDQALACIDMMDFEGKCRQAISEFKIPRIIMANLKGAVQVATLAEILPFAFTDNDL